MTEQEVRVSFFKVLQYISVQKYKTLIRNMARMRSGVGTCSGHRTALLMEKDQGRSRDEDGTPHRLLCSEVTRNCHFQHPVTLLSLWH